jgi:hypothetical protein
MADDINPYQSPQNPVNPAANSSGQLTENMLRYLKGASPWLRFVGIVGFIACGFLALIGLVFLFSPSAWGSFWSEIPGFGDYTGDAGAVVGVAMGLYFFIAALLYFFPALFQYKFGSKIRGYLQSGSDQDLETAFKNNKSLWKFNGILLIIVLALFPAMLLIGIIIGIASAFA